MFQLIEHTADMGLEARAASAMAALEEIARALTSLMFGECEAKPARTTDIVVRAEDPVELLVAWLNEIVYWCEHDNLVPATFKVRSFCDNELHATVSGEPFDPQRHAVERQVKSVTYHQACFDKTAEGWHARVFVDL